jgi:transcriptional regulator with XRE-family HTH domain
MRRTVVDPRFAAILTGFVLHAGVSQAELARRAHVSQPHLSELLNGRKNPSAQTAHALDEALGANGALTDLIAPAGDPGDLDEVARMVHNAHLVNEATIDALAGLLAAQRHLDDRVGAASILGPVTAHANTVAAMVVNTSGVLRQPLLYQASQWAQFTGWLHTSAGQWTDARAWFARGLEWATEHGDPDLIATVVSYQAHVAWLNLQWGPTVGLSRAALRDPHVYPGQRAYDAYQAAKGHAALGDLDEARRMVDLGDEIAATTDTVDGHRPPWQYYRAPWVWSVERGLVWLYMARWDVIHAPRAVADLTAGIAGMPADLRQADWAAEYVAQLAGAHIRAGQLEQASAVLVDARRVAEATGSGRVLRLVENRERKVRTERLVAALR